MLKKGWLLFLVFSILMVGSGCGLLSDDDKKEADKANKSEETSDGVAEINFGDYPNDDNNWTVLNKRKHFGIDETFSFSVKFEEKIKTTRLKVRIIKMPGGRVLQEIISDERDPSSTKLKWKFTNSSDFHGFYETGDYKMEILRGSDLLAEGEFTITD